MKATAAEEDNKYTANTPTLMQKKKVFSSQGIRVLEVGKKQEQKVINDKTRQPNRHFFFSYVSPPLFLLLKNYYYYFLTF